MLPKGVDDLDEALVLPQLNILKRGKPILAPKSQKHFLNIGVEDGEDFGADVAPQEEHKTESTVTFPVIRRPRASHYEVAFNPSFFIRELMAET